MRPAWKIRAAAPLLRPSATRLAARSLQSQCHSIRSYPQTYLPSPSRAAIRALHTQKASQQAQAAVAQAPEADSIPEPDNEVITRFEELRTRGLVNKDVVNTITRSMGFDTMTDVQQQTILGALKGKDVVAQARTGTGKTLGFLIPVLERMVQHDPTLIRRTYRQPRTSVDDTRAMIISPTRELAEQIAAEARRLVHGTGVIIQTAVGGTMKQAALRQMQREGCHILVGTPGRIKDIFSDPRSGVSAPGLQALVFDEADRLMDQGFWPEIQDIMQLLPSRREQDRQTLMFSATIPKEVVSLVRQTLKPDFDFIRTVRDDEVPTHERVQQRIVSVAGIENQLPVVVELVQRALAAAKEPEGRPFKAIIFFNSTAEVGMASSLFRNLSSDPENSSSGRRFGQTHPLAPARIFDIHSKLTQAARTRAADNFRTCTSGILLSSDVTARGMDFPNVTHVIQLGVPRTEDTYIHRIGRTARAGKEGEAWLIVPEFEYRDAANTLRALPIRADDSFATASADLAAVTDDDSEPSSKVLRMVRAAAQSTPPEERRATYRALIGVYNQTGNKQQLIQSLNDMAKNTWGMDKPPALSPALVAKMGLSRVRGLNIGHDEDDGGFGGASRFGRPGQRDLARNDVDPFRSDSALSGFGRRDSGSFGRRDSGSFGRDSSSFGRRDSGSGGFGRRDSQSGGFRKDSSSGFGRSDYRSSSRSGGGQSFGAASSRGSFSRGSRNSYN